MRKYIFILLFIHLSYAQDKKSIDIGVVDGITKSDIYLNLKLNDRWFIQNKLRASYFENAFYQLEVPITLQYRIKENWTVFMGPRFNYVNNLSFQNYNFSFQLGTRYYFSRRFYAEIFYEYNFLEPSRNSNELVNQGNFFKFGIGYQF